ncbi:hypothetical protein KX724_07705 [Stenotrophomonas indicatrix]|uniref:hypothetical protein n=1 Tax=Stenotrophomonas indicatrix TaxID=2045451 RepID=UPI001C4F7CBC|nr:hypothetical protein [Stenotrophomonas indicatrix]QXQ03966.1 hypothetical protein KX724_07705 [Stenotrophomonas indicatrix]
MITKHGWVRNPLSVIAIFAGVAEVGGAAVLPQLEGEAQANFMIFVMFFPCALVGLFFYILWFKAKVLYAPADYKDDANYMAANGLAKYSVDGKIAGSSENEPLKPTDAEDPPDDMTTSTSAEDESKAGSSEDVVDDKPSRAANETREPEAPYGSPNGDHADVGTPPAGQSIGGGKPTSEVKSFDAYVAEKRALARLHKFYGGSMTAPVIMSADGGPPYMIDGFIENETNQFFIEVIYASRALEGRRIVAAANRLATAWNAAPEKDQKRMICVICIVAKSKDHLRYHEAYAHSLLSSFRDVHFRIEAMELTELQ